ncbi:metallophosphoesterase [filamentous cyanobacterium CCP1]|nr:metallophosphoesterase [filamentous cyanobacterium CCP2]PSB65568.1 metallophosphoesterase [filamentous cyanobacterium CCP1]
MRHWRSLQVVTGCLLGLCLSLILYSCQGQEPSQVAIGESQAEPSIVAQASTPPPLPPETEAILDNAAPAGFANPPRGDVRIVVISDLNGAYGATTYNPDVDKGIALIPFWQPDLVLCSGDMVAGQDLSLTDDRFRAMWAAFDQHVAAPLRQNNTPYGFTMGNHDASAALRADGTFIFQRERDLAVEYWHAPEHDPGVQFVDRFEFPFYYTFEQKGVFFMAWDGSSHHIPPDKLAWVEQALASEQAQAAKMRILVSHLPLYAVATGRDSASEVMENADALREMLERYNVHTYVSGHHHAYYPGHKGRLQLLHTGILGAGPRPLLANEQPSQKTITVLDINFDAPELTTYTTYDIQTLEPIQFDKLPRFLTGHNGMVLRRDVEPEELTASERSVCETRLSAALCAA